MARFTMHKPLHALLYATALLAGLALLGSGCGGKEVETPPEEAAAPPLAPVTAVEEPAIPNTAPPSVPMGDIVPVTLSVLQYMPEKAQVALALPPAPGLLSDLEALARVGEPEAVVRESQAELFRNLGADLGIEAGSFEELAAALAADPNAPIGVFFDFEPMVKSAADAQTAARASGAAPLDTLGDAGSPAWLLVYGATDPAAAIEALERIADRHEKLRGIPAASEEAAGVRMLARGDFAYFAAGRRILAGNLDLLRGAAERVATPATLRYGTVECPAAAADEVAMLVYGGRFLPLMRDVMPVFAGDKLEMAIAAAQLEKYEKTFGPEDNDPIVVTAHMAGDRLEFLVRADTATHPGMLETAGPAAPLRLARLLPENTEAFMSIRTNDQFKAQMTEAMLPQGGQAADPDAIMQLSMASQILSQIGDEITLGIAPGIAGMPEIHLLLGLAQPQVTQGILQVILQPAPAGEVAGTAISRVDTPLGLPVFLSYLSDFAIASTSETGIRGAIERHQAGQVSSLFAAMDPPFDIDAPRYQAAVINTAIAQNIAGAAAMFSPDAPALPEYAPFLTAFRQIRASQDLDGSWLTGRLTVYLGDLAAAAALREQLAESGGPIPAASSENP
ncbi:MAG: hypothetical protein KF886_20000 [Candidatus Hydrogenedentes bacterium]|nr:hypothetical protein [Candidatus Hydrogenedentota bacterium]